MSAYLAGNGDRGVLGLLGEGDNTVDGRVSLEDSDSLCRESVGVTSRRIGHVAQIDETIPDR